MKYDYSKEVLKVLSAIIIILLVVALIPDFEIKYKHFNILSDIIDKPASEEDAYSFESLEKDLMGTPTDNVEYQPADTLPAPIPVQASRISSNAETMLLEDFSEKAQLLLSFFKTLHAESRERPVRIGVIGDSFIESDIITAQLRKRLQSRYGGKGVGYIPVVAPVAFSRQSIQTEASGWTVQSMVHYKKADRSKFNLAGVYYTPAENAFATVKSTASDSVSQIIFTFINTHRTKLRVAVNEQDPTEYKPESSDELQFLTLSGSNIQTLKLTVNDTEGFTAFGFYRNMNTGVYVDNYSVRGSSGLELSVISQDLTRQLSKQFKYDLLIVEYGLNVMEADKTNYSVYRRLMKKTIDHLKECYPDVPIILMSIGDRASKNDDGNVSTHPGVSALVDTQRDIAQKSGIIFWNTFMAMGGNNSMVSYADHNPPMAGKDYTHVNHLGGIKIADKLFESLMDEESRLIPVTGYEK